MNGFDFEEEMRTFFEDGNPAYEMVFSDLTRGEVVHLVNSLAIAIMWAEEANVPLKGIEARRRLLDEAEAQIPPEVDERISELELLLQVN